MLHTTDFISDMAAAYTAADLVISVLEQDQFLSLPTAKTSHTRSLAES